MAQGVTMNKANNMADASGSPPGMEFVSQPPSVTNLEKVSMIDLFIAKPNREPNAMIPTPIWKKAKSVRLFWGDNFVSREAIMLPVPIPKRNTARIIEKAYVVLLSKRIRVLVHKSSRANATNPEIPYTTSNATSHDCSFVASFRRLPRASSATVSSRQLGSPPTSHAMAPIAIFMQAPTRKVLEKPIYSIIKNPATKHPVMAPSVLME